MNTTYTNRVKSPYQPVKRDVFDISKTNHPVREIIDKKCGTYTLAINFSEDKTTALQLKHSGIIAFICTIKKDGEVVGIGRSHSVLSPVNKYIERTVQTAFNYSFVDACSKATKILDTFQPDTVSKFQVVDVPVVGNYKKKEIVNEAEVEMMTEAQRKYLVQLVRTNIQDDKECDLWESNMSSFSKEEARIAIQTFLK